MKQVLQSLKDGTTEVADVPIPKIGAHHVLIKTHCTLVSVGTERMLLDFGKANLIGKVRQQPERVLEVLNKVKTDGFSSTYNAVKSKLDQPIPLGYSNVGTIVETNSKNFKVGDRVVSNGYHAEYVNVPHNLCAKVPPNINDETASFTVLGAIGLQGVRLLKPTLGESIVVFGLGIIGLLTVQILKANGCRVLAVDIDPTKLELAKIFGADVVDASINDDVVRESALFSNDTGVDGVILTASTKSSELISTAAKIARKRSRIVLVGVVGLNLNRADFYEKEISFQVSCSYGPGRYDVEYEDKGQDYPIGFVRWTEQRNFEAVLGLMSSQAIKINELVSHRFAIEEAVKAFELLSSSSASSTGILLQYNSNCVGVSALERSIVLQNKSYELSGGSIAFIGAGNYAGRTLLPSFKRAGAFMHSIVSGGGFSARHLGKKYNFLKAATDTALVLLNEEVDAVVIATRHNQHAVQVIDALDAGKHIFCEKPLCINENELNSVIKAAQSNLNKILMIGFNRRFAPHSMKIKELIDPISEPKIITITVNAGDIPNDHWTQDSNIGGGRIIGEACHFIDLLRFLVGSKFSKYTVNFASKSSVGKKHEDIASVTLTFEDGSVGVINYLANGHKSFPKERLEVFVAGKILQLDNFRYLRGWGWKKFHKMRLWRQDKGQNNCVLSFMEAIKNGGPAPINRNEIFEVSKMTIDIANESKI